MIFVSTRLSIRRVRPFWAVSALVVLLAVPTLPAMADEAGAGTAKAAVARSGPEQPGSQFVAGVGEKVIGVLKSHPSEDQAGRTKALDGIFHAAFDVDGMARFAAGMYWRRTSPAERKEYVSLFGDYVASLYARKFAGYQGETFVVAGERPVNEAVTAVKTRIESVDKTTPVEFRVAKVGGDYRIVDVYVAGVSMLITKRDEFNTVLSREGMEGLMQRLKATASG